MRRNVVAAALQAAGIIVAVIAAFFVSTDVGALAAGVGVFLVGVAVEGER